MARPTGRGKKVTSGGGGANRRGESGVSGPAGNAGGYAGRGGSGSGGSGSRGSSGSRGIGAGAIGAIAGLLLSNAGNNGGSGSGGNNKKSGLSKLLKIVLILVVLYVLYKVIFGGGCAAGDILSGGGVDDILGASQGGGISDILGTTEQEEEPADTAALSGIGDSSTADHTVANKARDKYTSIKGGGKDVFTIMVYMCGTDLESQYGMATSDLNEILHADIAENVNVIVETGGTSKWNNSVISAKTNQRYQATSKGLKALDKDVGKKSMVDAKTLSDFIKFAKKNYPADRYALIMWDHGGGSLSGYGYDQLFPNKSMSLDKLYNALKDGGCKFDFIGFDACLMAALETAVAVEPFADYLIASEETEPGTGWYYTNWLSKLSENTSMSTVDIGKNIIDDFVTACYQNSPKDKTTLSLIDLAELSGTVPEALTEFAASTNELVNGEDYAVVSDARSNSREFAASSKINQIDLIDFATKIGTKEGEALAQALDGVIKYNRTSNSITRAHGVSIYFPYNTLTKLDSMLDIYDDIGMDGEYASCIKSFANMVSAGQISTGGSGSLLGSLLTGYTGGGSSQSSSSGYDVSSLLTSFLSSGDYSSFITGAADDSKWFDPDRIAESADYIDENRIDPARLTLTPKNGEYVLALTQEEWELVQSAALNVFVDDGEGYIDLGVDNVLEYDVDGDLMMTFDGTWLTLNDKQVVAYYLVDETYIGDAYIINGYIPALLNGEQVEIAVVFDNENPYGVIAGARRVYADGETDTVARGLIELKEGDELDFICDYYDYDGGYIANYFLGEKLTVPAEGLSLSNAPVGAQNMRYTYRITDIYDNSYWLPSLNY